MLQLMRRLHTAFCYPVPNRVLSYPTTADAIPNPSVAIISAAGVWTDGAAVVIIPAGAITSDFYIIGVSVEGVAGPAAQIQLRLLETFATHTFKVVGAFLPVVRPRKLLAGQQVFGQLRSSVGLVTVNVRVLIQTLNW